MVAVRELDLVVLFPASFGSDFSGLNSSEELHQPVH